MLAADGNDHQRAMPLIDVFSREADARMKKHVGDPSCSPQSGHPRSASVLLLVGLAYLLLMLSRAGQTSVAVCKRGSANCVSKLSLLLLPSKRVVVVFLVSRSLKREHASRSNPASSTYRSCESRCTVAAVVVFTIVRGCHVCSFSCSPSIPSLFLLANNEIIEGEPALFCVRHANSDELQREDSLKAVAFSTPF